MKNITATFIAALLVTQPVITIAESIKYPKLKSGEWEITVVTEGLPMNMKTLYCIDEQTQNKMLEQSQQQTNCDQPKITQSGNTYFTEVKCKMGNQEMFAKSETTIKGDTEISVKGSVSGAGHPPMNMTSTGKYTGDCKNGRKPGDMVMVGPQGEINLGNIEQIQKMGKELEQKYGKK